MKQKFDFAAGPSASKTDARFSATHPLPLTAGFYPKTIGRPTMTPKTLQAFLHRHIPATAALGLEVVASDEEKTVLSAPHAPNRNHKNTVFGGSIALVATTCGWAAVHTHFPEADGNIVIQQGETRYLRPARNDLSAVTRSAGAEDWQEMRDMFVRRGKGKIVLKTEVFSEGELAAVFTGTFVALKS